ncbi:capsular polysaccharide biosynthesis protein [Secundilactobacillus oryzae JCM 18671]|uniref:Capsular polysaccharide biosynthesis protein n=1 Tax=Secundilactobacillus oryzae JCM 18671 TaxID=1291743 RepID=A0A081BIA1_9LACO|nr:hypothetical protein [Secundilactobacillus oryzae]GAK47769.1 capsular polysaccharide biosynthesis protein [Secundilactobacillus oryzae JCM 18671]
MKVNGYSNQRIHQLDKEDIYSRHVYYDVKRAFERNAQIIAEPQRLYKLVEDGVLAQVTATSPV